MKKLVVYLCLGAMVLGLAACGSSENQSSESTQQTVEATATPEATPSAEASQPEAEASGSNAADEGVDVSEGWSEEMESIKAAVLEAVGDNYFPDAPLDGEMLEMNFGITADMYDDYLAEMPMISVNVDTLLIVKAKDDKVEAVEAALNTYRDDKVNSTMQYPMNLGKIQASRVERIGNYVCFIQLGGDVTAAEESGDEAVIAHCTQENEKVAEAIKQCVAQ